MYGQPSESITLDFWKLVPEIMSGQSGGSSRHFVIADGTIKLVRRKTNNFLQAEFDLPSNDNDLATCVLLFCSERLGLRLILAVGQPIGPGEYKWRGVCPKKLKPFQMLYFDRSTQLFVSREAIGKPAPDCVNRLADDKFLLQKAAKKYGSFQTLDVQSYPNIEGDPDFASVESVFDIIQFDILFAVSGYPIPIKKDHATVDVLASIQNANDRQRRPVKVLKESKVAYASKVFDTAEKLIEEFKRRGLPFPENLIVKI